jgi:hypothetical protein
LDGDAIALLRFSLRGVTMDIEVQTLIFEARMLAESIAMGLACINEVSEIDVVRRMLAEVDAILAKAQAGLGTN